MFLRNKLVFLFIKLSFLLTVDGQSTVSYVYRSNSHRHPVLIAANLTNEEISKADFRIPVIVLIHGWQEDITTEWYQYISDSYFSLMECTIIFIDWSQAKGLYILAAFSVKPVGNTIGDFLISLQKNGLDLNKLHLVGFSLGAHVSGNTARRISSQTNITVHRITALDPAGPLFTLIPDLFNIGVDLDPSDAVIVDTLHTSLILGETKQIGTVDFYANSIFLPLQPGCLVIEICSHLRAPMYFNESILSCGLTATPLLTNSPVVVYGEHMKSNTTGVYYFDTNSEFPFAQGNFICAT